MDYGNNKVIQHVQKVVRVFRTLSWTLQYSIIINNIVLNFLYDPCLFYCHTLLITFTVSKVQHHCGQCKLCGALLYHVCMQCQVGRLRTKTLWADDRPSVLTGAQLSNHESCSPMFLLLVIDAGLDNVGSIFPCRHGLKQRCKPP